jgi:hypothetical protein
MLRKVGKWVLIGLSVLFLAVVVLFVIHKLNRPSDTERVERVLRYAATSGDPSICRDLNTSRYLTQVTGHPAPFAESACYSGVTHGDPADSLEIDHLAVDGDRATAVVRPTGGESAGTRLTLALVKVDDHWKLDRVLAIDQLNRDAFVRGQRDSVLAEGWPPAAAACVAEGVRRLPVAVLEARLLRGRNEPFDRIALACSRPEFERSLLTTVANANLSSPQRAVACARQRLRAASEDELIAVGHDVPTYGRLLLGCDRKAPFDFMRAELLAHEYLEPTQADCVIRAARELSRQAAFRLAFENERYDELIDGCEKSVGAS